MQRMHISAMLYLTHAASHVTSLASNKTVHLSAHFLAQSIGTQGGFWNALTLTLNYRITLVNLYMTVMFASTGKSSGPLF